MRIRPPCMATQRRVRHCGVVLYPWESVVISSVLQNCNKSGLTQSWLQMGCAACFDEVRSAVLGAALCAGGGYGQ